MRVAAKQRVAVMKEQARASKEGSLSRSWSRPGCRRSCYDSAMKFITMRELRNQTTQVIEELDQETGVVTSNGKPVGILLSVDDDFEEVTVALRQARAALAVSRLRKEARESGADRLTEQEIEEEIGSARRAR